MKIKEWKDHVIEREVMACTMNCSPRTEACDDCVPEKRYVVSPVQARDLEIAELRARIKELERQEREPVKRTGITDQQIKDMFKSSLVGVTPLHCTYHLPDQELVFAVRKLFKMAQQKRK